MSEVTPAALFPNYTATATDMVFKIADTNSINAAKADEATGDGREVLRSIIETAIKSISALPQAARPKGMNIVKSTPNFTTNERMEVTYSLTFSLNLDSASIPLVAEAPSTTPTPTPTPTTGGD